ncbi:GTP cyclohydrolase II [Niveispirillum sp. BGYR6]|uniref:GTP cyclohydrolase II n=1 Tax=Niveispirillum sp. BGYR6 TaxID=2971249 RepID=UPI0022B9C7AA|nr:GTP cyclohydrolase II [Niveispirillum sp. BGYR6]MDG5497177.1 GTP cyclohydrolase II [Niveispirillum sp. BGYR6]
MDRMVLELAPEDITQSPDRIAQRRVDRALSDLRRGEPVLVLGGGAAPGLLVMAAEAVSTDALNRLAAMAGGAPALLVSGQRGRALGLDVAVDRPVLLAPPAGLTADLARDLADPTRPRPRWPAPADLAQRAAVRSLDSGDGAEAAAIMLAKLARLLPATVVAPLPTARGGDAGAFARRHDLLSAEAADILDYQRRSARSLARVADAAVPLEDAERTRLVAFRPSDGGPEHLAIIIGDPTPGQPVLARLHSECFTGDLLGSLRCDCGPQLRGAIREVSQAGSGIVLYLAQEGRGIGLMNKLRAYRLQDGGLDTVDANTVLGFDADERVYLPAASMLKQLGFPQVRLMTNNPDKIAQLTRWGVEVTERVPHIFPSNGHNEAYLKTKAEKSGHLF